MHFLKSCTAANEWSRKKELLWKLFKITIMAVIPGRSLASTVGCSWPPNEAHKANWIMKGYRAHCQNHISHLLSFLFVPSHICTPAIHWPRLHTHYSGARHIHIFVSSHLWRTSRSHPLTLHAINFNVGKWVFVHIISAHFDGDDTFHFKQQFYSMYSMYLLFFSWCKQEQC